MKRLSRRDFLQMTVAAGAVATLPQMPGCGDDDVRPTGPPVTPTLPPTATPTPVPPRFFTSEERQISERIATALVPEGAGVAGASTTNAVEYIDRFLASFDVAHPAIFRSGPYSGRWPFPDTESGEPSSLFPRNAFLETVPLTRMQELAFRIELLGSGSVPNGDINAPVVPSTPGIRATYRDSLQQLEQAIGTAGVGAIEDEAVLAAFTAMPRDFQDAFLRHLVEGIFGPPEYGGNAEQRGWIDYEFDGDSQPLGHTLFDADGMPRDRPDQPNQSEDLRRPARAFSPPVEDFISAITVAQGGVQFF